MKIALIVFLGFVFTILPTTAQNAADSDSPLPARPPRASSAPKSDGPVKWIGVRVMPLMPTTRSHLKRFLNGMPEDAGLTVTDVIPESPAVVGGVERYDIILRADGQPLTNAESLQAILDKRNFGTSVRLDLVHEGASKTVYALVLEQPEGSPGIQGGFGGFRGRGGPGGPGGPGDRGPGRGGPFGNSTSTLTYVDAEGKQQKVTGDSVRDFFRKMREDEKFRDAVSKDGFTIRIKPNPNPPPQSPDGASAAPNQ